jgi:hypothetical protein
VPDALRRVAAKQGAALTPVALRQTPVYRPSGGEKYGYGLSSKESLSGAYAGSSGSGNEWYGVVRQWGDRQR